MFERVLLATDFSSLASRKVAITKHFARLYNSTVHLVHVDEERALGMHSSDELIHFMNEIDQRRKEWMESLAIDFENDGFSVELERLEGVASEEIVRYAETHNIGLIVMGTLGHTSLKHLLLGSTGQKVLQHSPCAVLTVTQSVPDNAQWDVKKVLYPTDFSPQSIAGLSVGAELTQRFEAMVSLVHVLKAPAYIPAIPGEPPLMLSRNAFSAAMSRASQDLTTLESESVLSEVGVTSTVTLDGDTAHGIVAHAGYIGADLIVIPRHGRGTLRSMLFGRVVEHVIKISPLPVLSFLPGQLDD